MNRVNRAIGCFVLFAIIGFVAMPAYGAVNTLGTPLSGWTGSTSFVSSVNPNLTGYVEWAVYGPGPGDFNPSFYSGDTYTPTPNEYVYAYQIFNLGSDNISKYWIPLEGQADNIGFFRESSDTFGLGVMPNPTFTGISESAIFSFIDHTIGPGQNSAILVFSSISPPIKSDSFIKDGGTTAEVLPVPTPVPEPASVLVWLFGLGLCLVPAISRRWKR
jgi:hypothetical protein